MSTPVQLLIGVLLASAASYLAYRLHTLTRNGAYGATVLGTIVFGLGGWQWAVLLLAFFILSSALTRAFGRVKKDAAEKYAKGGQRDEMQVLSNGGPAALFVIAHVLAPAALWPWIGFSGAIAAVNADTWGTELGVLDPQLPRIITTFRPADKGTSGAISRVGTMASALAAAVIAGLASAMSTSGGLPLLAAITVSGLLGSLADSLLGATLQAIYFCPRDQKETEKHPFHSCGEQTVQIRGLKWLNNDLVNVACGVTGAALALALSAALKLF